MKEEDRLHGRHMTGQIVEVYDGRKWPVVRCDNVCITPTDTTYKVTQSVLLSPSVHEKKRRVSKYTVAVGTTHGHIQVFLKDSDLVLGAYNQCPADEKCLMLIKRPKDASRKLLKTQSLNNLSMSDTQLYRQYDGTALNNPFMTHRVKGKISSHSVKEHTATDNLNTQPAVKKSGPPATSRYTKKSQAPHPNTFVPIPELGIYTPDQHVLQNGTYAQHCHNREVNNNSRKNHSGNLHQVDNFNSVAPNANNNYSSNSSFDESVSSYGFHNVGVLPGFDRGCYGRQYSESSDVYHSCIDLPNSQMNDKLFNTLNLCSPSHRPARNGTTSSSNACASSKTVQPQKDMMKEISNKMDPNVRSHSLGDLTTGLTFSLVGQKKYESVLSVISNSDVETLTGYSSDRTTEAGDSSQVGPAGRDIYKRFHETTASSHSLMPVPPSSDNNSECQAKGSSKNVSGKKANDSCQLPHQPKHHFQTEEPYQQKQKTQQIQQFQQHKNKQKQVQKHHSAPETYPQPVQHVTSPRVRKDSEDTTSSYKSALSDVRSCQDLENEQCNNRNIVSAQSGQGSKIDKSISNSSKIISSHSTIKSFKDGFSSAKTQPTVMISHPVNHPNRQQSPVKPRRSLPSVPLNETSERIKRFTEIMKSRMSISSAGSRNCSAGSNSSKHTVSRISSMGSSSSQTGHSRKSSLETASDSEVFIITNSQYSQCVPDNSQHNVFPNFNEASIQMLSQPMKPHHNLKPDGYYKSELTGTFSSSNTSAGYCKESEYNATAAHSSYVNRRKSYGGEAILQDSDKRNHYSSSNRNFSDSCHVSHEQNACYSQNQSMSGETPLPPGDRSADSGQTTGTNHSYNGSALDSGYTTNNDGENDSYKSNPNCYHHSSQLHPRKQLHSPEFEHQSHDSGNNPNNDQTNFTEHNIKYKSSNLASSHRFGSVQNVSSAQVHGNPKDFNILKNNQFFNNDKCSQSSAFKSKENGSSCLNQDMIDNKKTRNGSGQLVEVKNEVPAVSQRQLQHHEMHNSTNRRSWNYAGNTHDNKNNGFPDGQMKKYGRADERYRSSEILPSSRGYSDAVYVNMHQSGNTENKQSRNFKNQKQSINTSSQNFNSNNANGKLNSINEFAPLMSHSYHGDLDPGRIIIQPRYSDPNHEHIHKSNNATFSERVQPSGYQPGMVNGHWSTEFYRKSNGNHIQQQQDEVRPRPVPVSRANRLARGHTLPGGFCLNDSNSVPPLLGQDISLFHMSQKYDLAPIMLNLPQDKLLKDMTELSGFTVEISMVGVPGLSSNPQGKMPQIGTPGSAFTPVKNTLDQNKPLTARLKVICFSHIWDEIHNYTTLGRILKGDIVIEVNGWFCLGADVAYLKDVVESCKGAVTFTVARLKESDDTRYKGQTAFERIKGLESEISRLDDLIQSRDEKIKNFTSATGSLSLKQHTGTLSDINGKIPVEGMVIGGDEYVV